MAGDSGEPTSVGQFDASKAIPQTPEIPKASGLVERFKAAQAELGAVQEEMVSRMDSILSDAAGIAQICDRRLPTVLLDNYKTSDGHVIDLTNDNPEFRAYMSPKKGTFVGVDGKQSEVSIRREERVRLLEIHDPNDPQLVFEFMVPEEGWDTVDFSVSQLNESGEQEGRVDVSFVEDDEDNNTVEIEDIKGGVNVDPFDVARRTLDFARTAKLKPTVTPQIPPPGSTPPPASDV